MVTNKDIYVLIERIETLEYNLKSFKRLVNGVILLEIISLILIAAALGY